MQTNEEIKSDQPPALPERSRTWRILTIVVVLHAALLGGVVLIQGCGKSEAPAVSDSTNPPPPSEEKELPKDVVASEGDEKIISPNSEALTPEEQHPSHATATTLPAPSPSSVKPEESKKAGTEAKNLTTTETKPAPAAVPPAPVKAPVVAVSTPAVSKKYAVAKGDTLSKIARKYGVTPKELADMNKLTANTILKVGQKLTVPGKGQAIAAAQKESPANGAVSTAREASVASAAGGQTHVVKAGENPASIARQYGVSVTALMAVNHITDPRKVRINQKLVIPEAKASGTTLAPSAAVGSEIQPTASEEPVLGGKEVKGI